MSFQFLYIEYYKVEHEIKGYPEDYDYDEFYSVSNDFGEACKEFDKFVDGIELWDVDPEARNSETDECWDITGLINYVF